MTTRGRPSTRDREILRRLAHRIDPGDAGAHNNLGVLYFNKGMLEEAIASFRGALALAPWMVVADRNLEIAYTSTGYYQELAQTLEERLRRDAGDEAARLRLAQAHLDTAHFEAAAVQLRRLRAADPGDLRVLLDLARAEKGSGRYQEALDLYATALESDPDSAVLQLQIGELHYNRRAYPEAKQALLRATEVAPELAEAWHLLALTLAELGETARAGAAARRVEGLRPGGGGLEQNLSIDRRGPARFEELVGERSARPTAFGEGYLARYHRGVSLREKGLYDEAIRELTDAEMGGEDAGLVRQARAEVLLVAGRAEEAAALYRELLESQPESPKLWNELGVSLHRQGKVTEAEHCYRRALGFDGSYGIARNNLGVARMDQRDEAGARAAFDTAARGGDLTEALCNLGLHALRSGRKEDALSSYRAAVSANPSSAAGWSGVGAALAETDRLDEARHALARAIELEPQSAEPRYLLAFVLNRTGDVEGSLRETRHALRLDPYYTTSRYRLVVEVQYEHAEVLAPELSTSSRLPEGESVSDFAPRSGELAAAFSRLERREAVLSIGAPSAHADGYRLAKDYLGKGLLERALAEVRRVALAGGDPIEAAILTGDVYRRQRLEGEALERYDAALARLEGTAWSDRHARGWIGRGWSLLELGQAMGAAEAAGALALHDPDAPEAVRLLAEAHLLMGRYAEALEGFTRVAEMLPEDAIVLMRLGAAASAAGALDRAATAFARALRVDPDLLAAAVELGSLRLRQGDPAEAVRQGRAALGALPGYAEAALLVAAAERELQRPDAAVDVLVELLEADPYHLDALHQLGEILALEGRLGDAATAFRRVLRFDPGSGFAWRRLGDVLLADGQVADAVDCLRRALSADLDPGTASETRRLLEEHGAHAGGARRSA